MNYRGLLWKNTKEESKKGRQWGRDSSFKFPKCKVGILTTTARNICSGSNVYMSLGSSGCSIRFLYLVSAKQETSIQLAHPFSAYQFQTTERREFKHTLCSSVGNTITFELNHRNQAGVNTMLCQPGASNRYTNVTQ